MAQRLGVLAVLEWELGLDPSTHMTMHYSLELKIVGSDALFWHPRALHAYAAYLFPAWLSNINRSLVTDEEIIIIL